MQEAVSQILVDRAREAEGLGKMVLVSLLAHATLIAVIVLIPESWRSTSVNADVMTMTITFGGAQGPDTGGMTPLGSRPVQTVAPEAAKPRVIAPERPAARPPEMVAPDPRAKPAPKSPVSKPVDKSASKKPTSGRETRPGEAIAETGGVPFGRGLSTTSSGGAGQGAFTDYANFCCPAYLIELQATIKRNWEPNQGAAGTVQMKFTVLRDGTITDIQVEKPSHIALLDLASQRALLVTKKVGPLPREFPENRLPIHLIFEYQR